MSKTIGDLCQVFAGSSAPQDKTVFISEGIPFIRAGSLEHLCSGGSLADCEQINIEIGTKLKLRLAPAGTILFAKSGMSAMKNRVYCLPREAYVVSHLAGLIPNESVDSRYLAYWFHVNPPSRLINDPGYPSIRLSDISKMKFNPPSLNEQKIIATILDKASFLSQSVVQITSIRNQLQSSIFLEIFGDSTIEERFPRTTIDDNITVVSKGTTPTTHGMEFVSEGIPFLRVEDLVKNPIDPLSVNKAIDLPTHEFLSRSQLKANDILVSIAGTIGRISIVPENSPQMNCNQAVAFIRLKDGSVLRHTYLMHWLRSRDARIQMAGGAVTGTISNLSLGKIKELKVPVPPMKLQILFEKINESFNSLNPISNQFLDLYGSITQETFA